MVEGRPVPPSRAARFTSRPGRHRSVPRQRAGRLASAGVILEAATALFLRKGYAGTSMDEVAALAKVSKQTIYTHFADKQRLFSELVLINAERADGFIERVSAILHDTDDVERALLELARSYIGLVIRPEVLELRRLIIREAGQFPEVAETYYRRVPERTLQTLRFHLERLAERGLLRIRDPALAANHFVALILWVPLDRAMFHPGQEPPATAWVEQLAQSGVRVFLAAYGPRGGGSSPPAAG